MFGGTSDPTLQVMVERADTRQLGIDDCEKISRRLSDLLDEADPIEHEYRLEVSSPGIDRPLTRPQDYDDWKGHVARVRLLEPRDGRKQFEGRIGGLDDGTVLLNDVSKLGEGTRSEERRVGKEGVRRSSYRGSACYSKKKKVKHIE